MPMVLWDVIGIPVEVAVKVNTPLFEDITFKTIQIMLASNSVYIAKLRVIFTENASCPRISRGKLLGPKDS